MKLSLKKWNGAVMAIATCTACLAQAETPASVSEPTNSITAPPMTLSTGNSVWKDGVGNGFQKGAREFGMNFSYAPGVQIFGSSTTHNFIFGTAQMGWVLTDVVMKDSPLRGNWEVLAELLGGWQVNHKHAYLTGLTGSMRYYFATGTCFVPFFEGGAGVMCTDIGRPDLSTAFQFTEKLGIGTQILITDSWAATLEVRFMHISNASIASPNKGVNTFPILLGFSHFF